MVFFYLSQIDDLIKIHRSLCEDHEDDQLIVQLSLDGVSESKSSGNTIDVFCVKFNHCRNIYPIRLIKPCERYKYDDQLQLKHVLDDLNDNEVVIDFASCDNPKRSNIKCVKCHSAKFPCEYCEHPAIIFKEGNKKVMALIGKKYKMQEKKHFERN